MSEILERSWLFEIVDRDTELISESFTLVLPPQSYEIKEKQRVSIAKTFGNVFIDDYGPDNLEITIKGISGTAHAFPTFRTKGRNDVFANPLGIIDKELGASTAGEGPVTAGYTGRGAFYEFRNSILRYKDKYPANFETKELRVYDLYDEQAYKCVLLEFTLQRDEQKPFRYNFTINLFVYQRMGTSDAAAGELIIRARDPFDILNAIDSALSWLNNAWKFVNSVKNYIAKLQNTVNLIRAKLNTYYLKAQSIAESPLALTKQAIDLGRSAIDTANEAFRHSLVGLSVFVALKETMIYSLRDSIGLFEYAIKSGKASIKEMVLEMEDGIKIIAGTATAEKKKKYAKRNFSGVNIYTIQEFDTLQGISQKLLGSYDYWPFVAALNNISRNSELSAGDRIYIPIPERKSVVMSKDEFIVTANPNQDQYGTDIKLGPNGEMVVNESNDVATVSGEDNVLQAVDNKISTVKGSMLKNTAYGLIGTAGNPGTNMALKYLRTNFRDCIMQDPRIKSVDNISVRIEADAIYLGGDIFLVNSDSPIPISAII